MEPASAESKLTNYGMACPPNSPLRRSEEGDLQTDTDRPAKKSFIWDQYKANDMCQHPEFRQKHGHTVGIGTGLTPIVPLFAFAKMPTHSDILATPLEQYSDNYIVSAFLAALSHVTWLAGLRSALVGKVEEQASLARLDDRR